MISQRIGVLLTVACLALGSSARANLVQNGDFETGDLTGWTLSVDPSDTNYVKVFPSYGSNVMEFGSYNLSTLSQTLTTTPGQSYTFHFDLAVDTDTNTDPSALFQANWNGSTVFNLGDMSSHGLLPQDFTVTATSATTDIQFVSINPASAFELDNVSVEEVPEPTVWVMALSGLGGFIAFRRMQRKR